MTRYTLADVIDRLGDFDSAWDIAAQFAVLGIRGDVDEPGSCPIANLIGAACSAEKVSVDYTEAVIGDGDPLRLPNAAASFAGAFDQWDFPAVLSDRSRRRYDEIQEDLADDDEWENQ